MWNGFFFVCVYVCCVGMLLLFCNFISLFQFVLFPSNCNFNLLFFREMQASQPSQSWVSWGMGLIGASQASLPQFEMTPELWKKLHHLAIGDDNDVTPSDTNLDYVIHSVSLKIRNMDVRLLKPNAASNNGSEIVSFHFFFHFSFIFLYSSFIFF